MDTRAGCGKGSRSPTTGDAAAMQALRITNAIIAVILVGAALWALRRILEPFVLALFLLILVDGLARLIAERAPRVPKAMSLLAALAAIVGAIALAVWLTGNNIAD